MPDVSVSGASADVSVVVPLRNQVDVVAPTLASLAEHRLGAVRLDVVVADDGSADGGPELIEERFPWARLYRYSPRGAAAARNRGIAAAQAPMLLLLDAGNVVEPGYFEPRVAALRANPEAAGAYGPSATYSSDGAVADRPVRSGESPYPIDEGVETRPHLLRLLAGWHLAPCATVWRTDAVRGIGGHDVKLTSGHEIDFLFRMLISGHGLVGCQGGRALCAHSEATASDVAAGRANDALRLRRRFASVLRESGLLDAEASSALGAYSFQQWSAYRSTQPVAAERFLALSRELCPKYELAGAWPWPWLSRHIGAERAEVLRGQMRSLLRGRRA